MQPPRHPPAVPTTFTIDSQRAMSRLKDVAVQTGNRELSAHVDGAEWYSAAYLERDRAERIETALNASISRVMELEAMIDPDVLKAHDDEGQPPPEVKLEVEEPNGGAAD